MKRSLAAVVAIGCCVAPVVFGQTTKPAPAPGTYEAYQVDANAAEKAFKTLIPNDAALADSNAQRGIVAPKAIALAKQIVDDLDKATVVKPAYKWQIAAVKATKLSELYALGDPETVSKLDQQAKLPGRDNVRARRISIKGQWDKAGADADKQELVIDAIDQLAESQPGDSAVSVMISECAMSSSDPAVKRHMIDLLTNKMDNMYADVAVKRIENSDTTHKLQGKPMVLSGKQPDGSDFSTADWKGKVILVDFWAAWCEPCKAELPRVKKMYEQYHDKGFEVVGVDNDYAAQSVIGYSAAAKLPWPQLFDADQAARKAWNPITVASGIDGIPVMFLIDKKGVCRTVTARADFEKLIPQMLAE